MIAPGGGGRDEECMHDVVPGILIPGVIRSTRGGPEPDEQTKMIEEKKVSSRIAGSERHRF